MQLADIHCHLLPAVDDGAKSWEETGRLLDKMAEEGVKMIIVTPHYRLGMFETPMREIWQKYQKAREMAKEKGIWLFLGCEIYRSGAAVRVLRDKKRPSMAGSSYVLVEFSPQDLYQTIHNQIYELKSNGWTPIIAHVERYDCCRENWELVRELSRMGACIQVNANAVTGGQGRGIRKFCKKLLEEELVDFAASDAHDEVYRPPNLKKCAGYIERRYGKEYAHRIFIDNPKKILADRKNRLGGKN